MNSKIKQAVQLTVFLLIGIVLLYFAFRGIDLNELMVHLKQADFKWVALSLVFAVLGLVFRAIRWRMLMEPIDAHPKLLNILHAINVGYLANFVFPRIGEITRCGILNRTDGLPVDKAFGTVIVERLFDVLMVFVMLALMLLFNFQLISDFLVNYIFEPLARNLPGTSSALWVAGVAVGVVIAVYLLFKLFRRQLAGSAVWQKVKGWLKGILDGIQSVRRMKRFGLFWVLNVLVFAMYFMQTYMMFFAFESTSSLGLSDALFVLVITTMAMIVPVQGGIGAYHGTVSIGLTVFGLTRMEGMVYATMSHTTTSLLFIVLGTVSLIFVFAKYKAGGK
ncbi:MAG: flippase-like domain-containing protein [Bacteroidales bacterium]|jgi:uncharacterized protein (TIRG00374 family)|nr:flippase-like domain-containing protein [Bacteroidales bacterium]